MTPLAAMDVHKRKEEAFSFSSQPFYGVTTTMAHPSDSVTLTAHFMTSAVSSDTTRSTHLRLGSFSLRICFLTMASKARSGVKSPVLALTSVFLLQRQRDTHTKGNSRNQERRGETRTARKKKGKKEGKKEEKEVDLQLVDLLEEKTQPDDKLQVFTSFFPSSHFLSSKLE